MWFWSIVGIAANITISRTFQIVLNEILESKIALLRNLEI